MLLLFLLLLSAPRHGGAQDIDSYAGQVLLPTVESQLSAVMEEPWSTIRFTVTSLQLGFLDSASTTAVRQYFYNQIVAVGVGDRTRTSVDMIYAGMEDGRFIGYFSPTSYTERGPGQGSPSALPWDPWTLATINAVCPTDDACRGETGKTVAASCPVNDARQAGVCSHNHDSNDELSCTTAGYAWYAPCTLAGCCDCSVRNYYHSIVAEAGQPGDFKRWRIYDPRLRSWYTEMVNLWRADGTTTLFSSMYEFSTSQALGLSAMSAMLDPAGQIVGVYAIDYDVGALSAIVNRSLTGSGSFGFAVERSNGKLVAVSNQERLYDKAAMASQGISFFDARRSAVDAGHPSVREAARILVAESWPAGFHYRSPAETTGGLEFSTAVITVHGLDWLAVAGMDIRCQPFEIWDSAAGRCKACRPGTQPVGTICQACPSGWAGTDGRCEPCGDGAFSIEESSFPIEEC